MSRVYHVFVNDKLIDEVEVKADSSEQDMQEISTYLLEKGLYDPQKDNIKLELKDDSPEAKVIDARRYQFKSRLNPIKGGWYLYPEAAISRSLKNLITTYGENIVMECLIHEFNMKKDDGAA